MANLNKVMLIGRLTRDPETRTFPSGGKVAKFGLAVAYIRQRKNPATGEWEGGETAFIDVEAFNSNREGGRMLADLIESRLRKGQQVYIEGRLRFNQWETDGQKRSKLLVVADSLEFLDAPGAGSSGEEGARPARSAPPARRSAPAEQFDEREPEGYDSPGGGAQPESDIPF